MKVTYKGYIQKVGAWLRISISNIYLKLYMDLNLNPNSVVTYIISDVFISSLIHLMISDLHL